MIKDIMILSKTNRISNYKISIKMTLFIIPIMVLSYETESIIPSVINLIFTSSLIYSLEIPKILFKKFIGVFLIFIVLGTIPIIIEKDYYKTLMIVTKGLSSTMSIFLFSMTTPIEDIFMRMSKYRITREIADIGKSMLRFIVLIEDEYKRVTIAMQSRCGRIDLGKISAIVFKNLLSMWADIQDSLESRGYRGNIAYVEKEYIKDKKLFIVGILYNFFIIIIIYLLKKT